MKKIISFFIAICIVFSFFTTFADDNNSFEYGPFDCTYKNNIKLFDVSGVSESTYNDLYTLVCEEAEKKNDEIIDISHLNIKYKDISIFERMISDLVFNNPKMFYIFSSYYYYIKPNPTPNDNFTGIKLVFTDHTTTNDYNMFFSKVRYILSTVIDKNMTDEEIVLVLHDYLIENITYDTLDEHDKDCYTAYGALVNGSAVCQGYSLAYKLLLKCCGIGSIIIPSAEMGHAWNLVKLNDKWYHVDLTWDDFDDGNIVGHNYFLLSDDSMNENDHYGWSTSYPACDDTKYENLEYCYLISNLKVKYFDGYMYYNAYKPVDIETLPPATTYYVIGGQNFIKNYYKSRFDGSDCTVIEEEVYNNIDSNKNTLNYYIDDDKTYIYLDENKLQTNDKLICSFYNLNKKLLGVNILNSTKYLNYYEFTLPNKITNTAKTKIMLWNNLIVPKCKNLSL